MLKCPACNSEMSFDYVPSGFDLITYGAETTNMVRCNACKTIAVLTPTVYQQMRLGAALEKGEKIPAIKAIRVLSGTGLREAKNIVDAIWPMVQKSQ